MDFFLRMNSMSSKVSSQKFVESEALRRGYKAKGYGHSNHCPCSEVTSQQRYNADSIVKAMMYGSRDRSNSIMKTYVDCKI